jgi:subtilisin
MGRVTGLAAALCCAAIGVGAGGAYAKPPASNVVDGRYIVLLAPGTGDVDREVDRQEDARGFRARHRYERALRGFSAKLAPGQVRALRADPRIAAVVPDRRVEALGAVALAAGDDAPAGVRRIRAGSGTLVRQASDVGVAVIDTGIDLDHPDLNAAHGKNCVSATASADDDEGHGTHVAGTIAARNDGAGVVGVAPGTRLYAVKVLDATGSGTWSQVICGIDWVATNAAALGIKVANMSLGGPGSNDRNCGLTDGDPLHQAICRLTQAGVLTVAAAGNDGWDIGDSPPDAPASYPEVLTVTAIADTDGVGGAAGPAPSCSASDADDRYASFSNYATRAADAAHMIAAPGVCIRSTLPGGGYGTASGTSMASPHVAGAVALCLGEGGVAGACASKSPADIIAQMRSEAAAQVAAEPAYGFAGDPTRPNQWGDYFGALVHVAPDTVAPQTTITAGPSGTVASRSASFSFSSTEPGSSFECRVDGGAWTACTSPRSLTNLADGAHSFAVRARDATGNHDLSEATRSWTVDTIAPDTSLTGAPGARSGDPTPTFTFSGTDATGFECRVDAGAWTSCASPHTTAALADGAHTFSVRARDAAGNVDATPATASFEVDTTAPVLTLSRPAAGATTTDRTPSLDGAAGTSAGDAAEVVVEVWRGSAASGAPVETRTAERAAATAAAELGGELADGTYTARASQRDDLGNVATAGPVTFAVDATAPDTAITSGPDGATKNTTPTFEFGSPETGARFECRVDAGAWTACASPHRTGELAVGAHTFAVRAFDAHGNADASPAERRFSVDPQTVAAQPPATSDAAEAPATSLDSAPAATDPQPATEPQTNEAAATERGDTAAPAVAAAVRRQALARVLRRGLRATVTTSEAASVTAELWRKGRRVGRIRVAVDAAGPTTVRVRLARAARARLARLDAVRLTLRVSARDAAGNARAVRRALRLTR